MLYFFFLLSVCLYSNPFFFEVPPPQKDQGDFLKKIEENIHKSHIFENINNLFEEEKKEFSLSELELSDLKNHLFKRLLRGVNQRLFSHDQKAEVVKIHKGSSCCIVTTVDGSTNRNPELISQMIKNLDALGFNGYLYYRIAGFPNPTGKEIQYASIPYSFKIFLMLEAYKIGFKEILWVDSRLMPIKGIEPIFDVIKKHHAFLVKDKIMMRANFLSRALVTLTTLTGVNPLNHYRIATPVFGLDFSFPTSLEVLKKYYECCDNGYPFLSVFPEEHVLSSIFARYQKAFPYIDSLTSSKFKNLWLYDEDVSLEESLKKAQKKQFFFFGLGNRSQFQLSELQLEKKINKNRNSLFS